MIKKPEICLIAAIDEKRGLGKKNRLLFKIPADLKRFKKITLGYPVIMGRKTFESIRKPLPNRLNIIITRNKKYKVKGGLCFSLLKQCFSYLIQKKYKKVFVIGGGEIYRQTINKADKLYLTIVKGDYKADVFFPEYYKKFNKKIYNSGWKKYQDLEYKFVKIIRL